MRIVKLKLKTALQSNPYDPKKGNESAYARYLRYVVDGFYGKSNEEVRNIWRKESRTMTGARAIELLKGIQFCCDFDDCTNAWDCDECVDAFNMAIEALEQDRPKGRWIENDNGTFSCSNCQSWIPKEQHHYARHCLYCGARMESDTE